jgi:hypothetical protein
MQEFRRLRIACRGLSTCAARPRDVTPRWALIGFVGAGRAWGRSTGYSDGNDTAAKGVGFRYLIARRLGLYVGMDYAHSTLDHAIYLQVGSAWR